VPREPSEMVTLKIPRPLYERLQQLINGTGFRSVTEFATYVLRDLAAQPVPKRPARKQKEVSPRMTEQELAAARERLRELGYLD
jgi:Arc/MetJ-type ribon-helix-helix transcriptional regulator